MEEYTDVLYTILPYIFGFLGICAVAIIIMKIRLHIIESKPKEEEEPDEVVITVDGRTKHNSS